MIYGIFKNDSTQEDVASSVIVNENKLPTLDGCTLRIVEKSEYDEFMPPAVLTYNADTLISWAMSQVFVADLIPHMAAFLDFANKASEASKTNFLTYAAAVNLTSTANTIVNQAVTLGADIEGV